MKRPELQNKQRRRKRTTPLRAGKNPDKTATMQNNEVNYGIIVITSAPYMPIFQTKIVQLTTWLKGVKYRFLWLVKAPIMTLK